MTLEAFGDVSIQDAYVDFAWLAKKSLSSSLQSVMMATQNCEHSKNMTTTVNLFLQMKH